MSCQGEDSGQGQSHHKVSDDGKTVTLEIADMKPTWSMEIKYTIKASDGSAVQGFLHNTVHRLGE